MNHARHFFNWKITRARQCRRRNVLKNLGWNQFGKMTVGLSTTPNLVCFTDTSREPLYTKLFFGTEASTTFLGGGRRSAGITHPVSTTRIAYSNLCVMGFQNRSQAV